MACRMQGRNPIQLNFTFPENGCRSDLLIYYHPTVGQQRQIFGCDWDSMELTYECAKLEPGVTWNRPDQKHAIITLPETFEQNSGYFRYQISCYESLKENECSRDPIDEERGDQIMQVVPVRSTTAMRTENTVQQDSNQNGNQELIGLVSGVTVGFIVILLILIIAFFFLCKRNRVLKGMIRAMDSKLQQNRTNTENQHRVESETEERESARKIRDLNKNSLLLSELQSLLSGKSPLSFEIISEDSERPNPNSVICTPTLSRSRIQILVNRDDTGRAKADPGPERLRQSSLVSIKEITPEVPTEEEKGQGRLDEPSPDVDKKH